MSDAIRQKRDELARKINAEIDALGAISDDTLAAVRQLHAEETELMQQLVNGEITEEDHYTRWRALRKRTPREVQLASLKIAKTLAEALSKDSSSTEA